jgi:hypothetical protein
MGRTTCRTIGRRRSAPDQHIGIEIDVAGPGERSVSDPEAPEHGVRSIDRREDPTQPKEVLEISLDDGPVRERQRDRASTERSNSRDPKHRHPILRQGLDRLQWRQDLGQRPVSDQLVSAGLGPCADAAELGSGQGTRYQGGPLDRYERFLALEQGVEVGRRVTAQYIAITIP